MDRSNRLKIPIEKKKRKLKIIIIVKYKIPR